jgi:hypothetical protein
VLGAAEADSLADAVLGFERANRAAWLFGSESLQHEAA